MEENSESEEQGLHNEEQTVLFPFIFFQCDVLQYHTYLSNLYRTIKKDEKSHPNPAF